MWGSQWGLHFWQVELDYTGIAVSDPLMPGTGMDLMASFISGETLDRKFAAMICDQVRSPRQP